MSSTTKKKKKKTNRDLLAYKELTKAEKELAIKQLIKDLHSGKRGGHRGTPRTYNIND